MKKRNKVILSWKTWPQICELVDKENFIQGEFILKPVNDLPIFNLVSYSDHVGLLLKIDNELVLVVEGDTVIKDSSNNISIERGIDHAVN